MREICRDGRMPVGEINRTFSKLGNLWIPEVITFSGIKGLVFPIMSYKTIQQGEAAFVAAGIHGEEEFGSNAMAESLEVIKELGKIIPTILLPLLNPVGYATNWRYVGQREYSETGEGLSINDMEHNLPFGRIGSRARRKLASCREAYCCGEHLISLFHNYPPRITIDLHQDIKEEDGAYVYSHGKERENDKIASQLLEVIQRSGIPIKMSGATRWGEKIKKGFVEFVNDSSIDDLLAAEAIIHKGVRKRGPNARTALAFELPGKLDFRKGVNVYRNLIYGLYEILREERETKQ